MIAILCSLLTIFPTWMEGEGPNQRFAQTTKPATSAELMTSSALLWQRKSGLPLDWLYKAHTNQSDLSIFILANNSWIVFELLLSSSQRAFFCPLQGRPGCCFWLLLLLSHCYITYHVFCLEITLTWHSNIRGREWWVEKEPGGKQDITILQRPHWHGIAYLDNLS